MATIEIDGKQIEAQNGSMIIQAADEHDIYIPRFCYHKKLSIAANCRMCLVQVGEGKKPMPACATPVADGMKVYTKSEVALNAQKAVMEFLLINHPLDCPICDQGGQCELQDLSMGFGAGESEYDEGKRSVKDKSLGPLIATEMTRCIHCTRCVRFSREIAGTPEIGMTNRGEHSEITTYVEKAIESEVSGNMIDVCPVGALTSKPSRFQARPWELQQRDSIAPHDCLGSNLHIHVRRNKVIKVSPKENEAINEVWLSDRDRFSYQGVNSEQRLTQPMIKQDGKWVEATWEQALEFTTEGLQKVLNTAGAEQLAALIHPSSTVEELYLLQKLMRGVGSENIDHRLHRVDFSDQQHDVLTPLTIAELEHLNACLLVGSNIQKEQPLAGIRLRKMVKNGGKLYSVTPHNGCVNLPIEQCVIHHDLAATLAGIAKALGSTESVVKNTEVTEQMQVIADGLKQGEKIAIILGQLALNYFDAASVKGLSQHIAELASGQLVLMTDGANTAGAMMANAMPENSMHTQKMLADKLKAYILFNVDPEFDCANPAQAVSAVSQADFVVSLSPFDNASTRDYADVLLPITPFTEMAGTFVNIQHDWQSFTASVNPLAEARPGWKVLRVLGNFLKVDDFDYDTVQQVRDELYNEIVDAELTEPHYALPSTVTPVKFTQRVGTYLSARVDNIIRHATALQQMPKNSAKIIMNPKTAAAFGVQDADKAVVKQNGNQVALPLFLSDKIADDCVFVPSGFSETAVLGDPSGEIEVQAC